jgi:hypothetical protein
MGKFSDLLNADKPKGTVLAKPEKSAGGTTSDLPKASISTPETARSTSRSIIQSTKQSANKLMDRPRGFYITERLNDRIDTAVKYFQDVHGIKKADRSVVVTAMLDQEENWTDEALDQLVDRLMSELTNRLTN